MSATFARCSCSSSSSLERAGLENRPLLEAQRAVTVPSIAALETRLATSVGAEHVFVRFRLESTRSVVFFIDGMLEEAQPAVRRAEDRREASSNS